MSMPSATSVTYPGSLSTEAIWADNPSYIITTGDDTGTSTQWDYSTLYPNYVNTPTQPAPTLTPYISPRRRDDRRRKLEADHHVSDTLVEIINGL